MRFKRKVPEPCVHCARVITLAGRGLCWACFDKPLLRLSYKKRTPYGEKPLDAEADRRQEEVFMHGEIFTPGDGCHTCKRCGSSKTPQETAAYGSYCENCSAENMKKYTVVQRGGIRRVHLDIYRKKVRDASV